MLEFSKSYQDIYPKELQLKCEHQGTHATFLDSDITIGNGIFEYKLFDKRNNYNFFIVRMPDFTGNIPSHIFYGSIMSEILRIARCTLHFHDFAPHAKTLMSRMLNQGAETSKLRIQIKKAILRHPTAFTSFNKSKEENNK